MAHGGWLVDDDDDGDAYRSFLATPPELLLFALFSMVASTSALGLTFAASPAVVDAAVPVVGWSAGSPYMFCAIFAVYAAFTGRHPAGCRLAIVAVLLVGAASGVWSAEPANDHPNPYLRVSPWRSAWTVAVPLVWAVALLAPPLARRLSRRLSRRRTQSPADE